MTSHFWVQGELFEVDYDPFINHGSTGWQKVHASEKRCACPAREKREEERRRNAKENALPPFAASQRPDAATADNTWRS